MAAKAAASADAPREIRDVWAVNLVQEINVIQTLIDRYPYVAMVLRTHTFPHQHVDLFYSVPALSWALLLVGHLSVRQQRFVCQLAQDTEFPGIVVRPVGTFKNTNDYHYQTLKSNVDVLKIIQLGITLSDENGKSPEPCGTWQFNFKFSLMYGNKIAPRVSRFFDNVTPIRYVCMYVCMHVCM